MRAPRSPFDEAPLSFASRAVPPLSVMAGSLVTIFPMIATFPVLPPFGLLVLIGWRLMRPDAFRIWAPLPLGLFDDIVSGQPIGSAILLWTLCFLVIDLIDRRLMYRDFWQDWLTAAGAVGFCLIGGRLFASPLGTHVDTVLLMQIIVSALLYPLVARLVGWLDYKRLGPT